MSAEPATREPLPLPVGEGVVVAPQIDATTEELDESEFEPLEFDGTSTASTSVTSSVWQHEYENGRRYHHYRHGRYPIPNDDIEQGRDHMKHAIHLEACGGQLYFSPIGDNPQKIMDLCTGTGLWAIDIADKFPGAEVIGLDLSPIQPKWVPPNVKFMVDDIEADWLEGDSFDFVHIRHSTAYLRDVDRVLGNSFDNLKPGGWMEIQEFGGYALCDDGTMHDDYAVNECFALIRQAMAKMGTDYLIANKLRDYFERAGFVNIQCEIIKTPIGPWPRDKTLALIGSFFKQVLLDLLPAIGNKPFRSIGMEPTEIAVLLAQVRNALNNKSIHSYFNFITWYGQKPKAAPPDA